MAAIDKLLQGMVRSAMETLVLAPGHYPYLRRGNVEHQAGKRPLGTEQVALLLAEIAPGGRLPEPGVGGDWRFEYRVAGQPFSVTGASRAGGWRATIVPAGAATDPGAAAETPAPGRFPPLDSLLARMSAAGASDLHLASGEPVRLRIDGDLKVLDDLETPDERQLDEVLRPITPPRNRTELEETYDTDFAYELTGCARFRANLFRDHRGIAAAIRRIPGEVPSAEELGLPAAIRELAKLSKGLVLVTGPTGSGKSTTLAALLDLVNRSRRDHIITIEDPIEFVHPSKHCLVNQREVGRHVASFKRALRAALREDPDVVLVGEMRDLDTVAIALETAETGHLVFGTLHTTTAPSTVERLVDQFPGDRQEQIRTMLAGSLRAVISQTLLKRIGGGRIAAHEILLVTPAVSNLIREGKSFQIPSAMQTSRDLGMMLLNDALLDLVKRELVEPEEAYRTAVFKDTLTHRMRAEGLSLEFLETAEPKAAAQRHAPCRVA